MVLSGMKSRKFHKFLWANLGPGFSPWTSGKPESGEWMGDSWYQAQNQVTTLYKIATEEDKGSLSFGSSHQYCLYPSRTARKGEILWGGVCVLRVMVEGKMVPTKWYVQKWAPGGSDKQ